MALLLCVLMPAGWAVVGRLLGWAVSLSAPTEGGERAGAALGRWCPWLFAGLYCLVFFLGGSGDAGHGVRLFGSEGLAALLFLPVYGVPALGVYVIAAYVARDLVRGFRSRRP